MNVRSLCFPARELTGDLDLLWDGGRGQAPALAAAFAAAGASLADDQGRPLPCGPEAFNGPKVLFRSALACGECCTPALRWGELPVAAFLARCEVAAAGGRAGDPLPGPRGPDPHAARRGQAEGPAAR